MDNEPKMLRRSNGVKSVLDQQPQIKPEAMKQIIEICLNAQARRLAREGRT